MGSANRGTAIVPLSTIGTRYGNSVSTASMPPKPTSKLSLNDSLLQRIKETKPIRNFSIDPASSIRTSIADPVFADPVSETPTPVLSQSTAVQMGGALPYKWEAYCSTNGRCTVGLPFLQSLEARKAQRYKWGAYCRTNWRCTAVLSPRPVVGVSETLLISLSLSLSFFLLSQNNHYVSDHFSQQIEDHPHPQ